MANTTKTPRTGTQAANTPPGAGWRGKWRRHAVAAVLLAPVALWVLVRWGLALQLDRLGVSLPPELALAGDPVALMRSVILGLLACLSFGFLAWWLVRRPGPATRPTPWRRSVLWGLAMLWVLVWLIGAGQAVRSQLNAQGVQAAQTETLKLVGLRPIAPSKRSVGGAKLYLDWPAQGGLYTVLAENPSPELLAQPPAVQLQLAPGRWQGWYVLGWTVPPGGPAAAPTAPGAPDLTPSATPTDATNKGTP